MSWPLVELAFWSPGDPPSAGLHRLLADPATPLARHGLTGIAAAYAAETGASLHPTHRAAHAELTARSLAADGALSEVSPALAQAGVPHFVAKGPVAAGMWPSPSARPYADLDVYVPAGALSEARAALAGLGYRPVVQRPGPLAGVGRELHGGRFGAVVEVHDTVVDNACRRHLPPVAAWLEHTCCAVICGVDVPVLAPSAHLALLAVHLGAGHRYARLSCWRDVTAHLGAFDPEVTAACGAGVYLAVVADVLRAWGVGAGEVAGLPEGPLHRRLVRALATTDPACWDEHAATRLNVTALLNQPRLRAGVRAGAGVWRAVLPRRGRRAPLRVGPVVIGRGAP